MQANQIVEMPGYALSAAIHGRQVSCAEVMDAYLRQIERLNPSVNAIVQLQPRDTLMDAARQKDAALAAGQNEGWMHGFPQAIKDIEDTKGIPSTKGSRILKDNIPDEDSPMVADLKQAGAIVIGKTNVPEWGYGSQTYNEVYGATGNPFDPAKTCGGSSGGAACALSLRMQAVADGSDFMGSLRNPAGFCNVYGMRPTPGRVANTGADSFFNTCGTCGPMGRTVADVALLLATQSGYKEAAPLSLADDEQLKSLTPANVHGQLQANLSGKKIGWLGDWNGYLAMESGVLGTCKVALQAFPQLGVVVDEAQPFFDPADFWENIWLPLRHFHALSLRPYYEDSQKRQLLKPEAIFEYEGGARLSAGDVFKAFTKRGAFYRAMLQAFEQYDFLAVPSAQVFPFDKRIHWPDAIEGRKMQTYHKWMEVVTHWTMGGNPAISIPAGFGPAGLPIGIQLIAKPRQDFALLQCAFGYEQATGYVESYRPALLGPTPDA